MYVKLLFDHDWHGVMLHENVLYITSICFRMILQSRLSQMIIFWAITNNQNKTKFDFDGDAFYRFWVVPIKNRQNDIYIGFQILFYTNFYSLYKENKSYAFKRMMTYRSRVILLKIRTIGFACDDLHFSLEKPWLCYVLTN